jgi:hypothetical protein
MMSAAAAACADKRWMVVCMVFVCYKIQKYNIWYDMVTINYIPPTGYPNYKYHQPVFCTKVRFSLLFPLRVDIVL